MRTQSLQTRFFMAGCLLVLTTVAGGAWSVVMFARLSTVVGETLRESQEAIDLTARLADALEREDDALLLALAGKLRNAKSEVVQQRQDFDEAYARLLPRLTDAEENAGDALRTHADAYRTAGDTLLASAGQPGARDLYHEQVNPALREAVADCRRIRELKFASMQKVSVEAQSETKRSTGIVAGIALVALGLSTLVMVPLSI